MYLNRNLSALRRIFQRWRLLEKVLRFLQPRRIDRVQRRVIGVAQGL